MWFCCIPLHKDDTPRPAGGRGGFESMNGYSELGSNASEGHRKCLRVDRVGGDPCCVYSYQRLCPSTVFCLLAAGSLAVPYHWDTSQVLCDPSFWDRNASQNGKNLLTSNTETATSASEDRMEKPECAEINLKLMPIASLRVQRIWHNYLRNSLKALYC